MRHQNLWAPWRISYLKGLVDGPSGGTLESKDDCFLCAAFREMDESEKRERMVLFVDERGALMMNRYPYSNGHLLVAPKPHVP